MKLKLLLLVVVLAMGVIGCSGASAEPTFATEAAGDEAPAEEAPAVAAGEPVGFPFEYGGQTIYMGLPAEPIVAALGEPLNYFEAPSCAFEGIDKTYFYNGFELHTFPTGDKDYVLAVLFTDDSVATADGVYLGLPEEDALSASGDGYVQEGSRYTYTEGKGSLSFIIEDGVVAELSYNYVVD